MKTLVSLGLRHEQNELWILDQTMLPKEEHWIRAETPEDMIELIQRLAVRGAPLIGVAAAVSLARFAEDGATISEIIRAAQKLREARPTAVNLMKAVDRCVLRFVGVRDFSVRDVVTEAEAIFDEDVALCEAMARHGETLIQDGDGILTHCNTGGLATAGVGTALGVIWRAHKNGKHIHVYVDETRPLLQGARLTTWELDKLGIPFTLICDSMAAFLMAQKKIQKVFTGADRIAANGDTANKVGTYSVAVAAKHHGVPFYIVAPHTTFDENCPTGAQIPIEERAADEIRRDWAPANCRTYNPAFDVTPRALITGIVTERGVFTEKFLGNPKAAGQK